MFQSCHGHWFLNSKDPTWKGSCLLQTIAGVGLGEALALLDGHQLELGLLVNVQPGVRVAPAVPGHIGTTSKASKVPACDVNERERERERRVL